MKHKPCRDGQIWARKQSSLWNMLFYRTNSSRHNSLTFFISPTPSAKVMATDQARSLTQQFPDNPSAALDTLTHSITIWALREASALGQLLHAYNRKATSASPLPSIRLVAPLDPFPICHSVQDILDLCLVASTPRRQMGSSHLSFGSIYAATPSGPRQWLQGLLRKPFSSSASLKISP